MYVMRARSCDQDMYLTSCFHLHCMVFRQKRIDKRTISLIPRPRSTLAFPPTHIHVLASFLSYPCYAIIKATSNFFFIISLDTLSIVLIQYLCNMCILTNVNTSTLCRFESGVLLLSELPFFDYIATCSQTCLSS